MGEGEAESSQLPGRPVLLAVLLTSLFWVIVAGLTLLLWRRPQPVAFEIQPPPATWTPSPTATPAPLVVEVTGAVRSPGVYRVTPGARLEAVLADAGGTTANADMTTVNLARAVQDGEQVVIPARSRATSTPTVDDATATPASRTAPVEPASARIDINLANAAQLEALPGIGPKTAQAILEYRQTHGPFVAVEDLLEVKGIGESTLGKIRAFVTVGSQ